jgi:putative membrane protein
MTTDLILAFAHHIAVFGLFGLLVAEAVLLRRGMTSADVARVARVDAAYGAMAGAVVAVGVLRLIFGAKGWPYYEDNPWFWAKMASFGAVALVSILPTIRFLGWRRRLKADPGFLPDEVQVAGARRLIHVQFLLIALVLLFAATMARFA